MSKYILLETWAKQHGIKSQTAKDWARRHKLDPYVKKMMWEVERWVIESNYKPLC